MAKETKADSSAEGLAFQPECLLKSDLLGRVERGHSSGGGGQSRTLCRRDISQVSWWLRPIAGALLRRETRALRQLSGLAGVSDLVSESRTSLLRTWLSGSPMQITKPKSLAYFENARRLLAQIHRAGVAHNDSAKEPNWLVLKNGEPSLIDFQLATISKRRGKIFRILAREDIRHLLKHKRTYCPDSLTPRERKILQTPSPLSWIWMRTGKQIYLFMTRRIFGWQDREGAGDRGGVNP